MRRIFILGAGFSRPAGLPLGPDLWSLIRSVAEKTDSGRFSEDLHLYLTYLRECRGKPLEPDDVDFEDFLAFLDIEHRLEFSGRDTWSLDGNPSQIFVKQSIGRILTEMTPSADELPRVYHQFARQLEPGDYVLTFNYDLILEKALEHVEKAYRLFPNRYSEEHAWDRNGRDEVVVLKLHGSVDWFDRSSYEALERIHAEQGGPSPAGDLVFSPDMPVQARPLLEDLDDESDRLSTVYRVTSGLELVYSRCPNFWSGVPFLLTPSRAKVLYADQFRTFWWGMGNSGWHNLGVNIIGYSIPEHDEYAQQALFRLLRNYQERYWDEDILVGLRKKKIILVDRQSDQAGQDLLRKRYGFLQDSKTHYVWSGFDESAVRLIERGVKAT